MLIATGNRLRSSFSPSCLPATEKGGQGRPPETISTPLNAEASVNLLRSSSITFHCGRLCRSVAQAWLLISIKPAWSMPACSRPSAWPPPPAHNSRVVSVPETILFGRIITRARVVRVRGFSLQRQRQLLVAVALDELQNGLAAEPRQRNVVFVGHVGKGRKFLIVQVDRKTVFGRGHGVVSVPEWNTVLHLVPWWNTLYQV